MAVVLDNTVNCWEKCWDRITYTDMEGYRHVYTPDFKIFLSDGSVIYLETKGFINLSVFNRFNDIQHADKRIYLIFLSDLEYLERTDVDEIDFTKFSTMEQYVQSNYEHFWR